MPINMKGKNRTSPKPKGISSALKKGLKAKVWWQERDKAEYELQGVRKRAGDLAAKAKIVSKGWDKKYEGVENNPHGKSYKRKKKLNLNRRDGRH